MTANISTNIWERLGAAEGLWATGLLLVQWWLVRAAIGDPTVADQAFVDDLTADRIRWESVTLLRLIAGLMIVWFTGSLAGRLRLVEGEPGRLASIALGVGVIWGAVWLVSALFNSLSVIVADQYANSDGAALAGVVAHEAPYILTPALLIVITFATGLVGVRFGGMPAWYPRATLGTSALVLVLALADWYGPGTLSEAIMALALLWLSVTAVVLMRPYAAPDPVEGTRGLGAQT